MKQLKFTTTKPYSFFSSHTESALIPIPENSELIQLATDPKCENIYIDGDAEKLAGFDLPVFFDGDMNNIHLPIKEQDIVMILPDGEYKCKCTIEKDLIDTAYYLTLY